MSFNLDREHLNWRWAVCALLALALAACNPSGRSGNEDTARAELVALQDAWVAAEIAGDADTLRSLMDERFLSISPTGETLDRDGFINWITSFEISPFTADLDRIELHGDTAVVICFVGTTKITWIAVRKQGTWQVVAQTLTRMTPPDG